MVVTDLVILLEAFSVRYSCASKSAQEIFDTGPKFIHFRKSHELRLLASEYALALKFLLTRGMNVAFLSLLATIADSSPLAQAATAFTASPNENPAAAVSERRKITSHPRIGALEYRTNNVSLQCPAGRAKVNGAMLLADRINEGVNVVEHEPFELCDVGPTKQLAKDPPPF